jgi:Cd(II)/Pb(II)-responsive transcriptional regulator
MKIGDLAQAAQCTVETIRYYEKEGLLAAPARSASNYRQYGPAHADRLRFIRNCRMLDMTHDEIRALLGMMDRPQDDCTAVNHLLDEHIEHVEVRIQELQQLKHRLAELRGSCSTHQEVQECGILQGLASMETEVKPSRHTHLG